MGKKDPTGEIDSQIQRLARDKPDLRGWTQFEEKILHPALYVIENKKSNQKVVLLACEWLNRVTNSARVLARILALRVM